MTRLLRVAEVLERVGFGRSQLYRKISAGTFPQPVKIGEKSIRFLESDVEAWVAGLPRRSDFPKDSST